MQLNKDEIKAILLFLNRTTSQGQEARVWTKVVDKLEKMYMEPDITKEAKK